MGRVSLIVIILFCLAGAAAAQNKPLPQFRDFPTRDKFAGKPARPKLNSKRARLFRTNIKDQTAEGANFAGHFRIATWGCGSGCIQFAIIDVQTGDVYFPPDVETVMVFLDQDDEPLQYQVSSRLLVVLGHKEKTNWQHGEEGKFFYEWKNQRLVLIRKVKLERKQDQL